MQTLSITRPDDWHLHVRDGANLGPILAATTRCFARAIIMPNLNPPVTSTDAALAYRERILGAIPDNIDFTPLMTLYLTDKLSSEEIRRAMASGHIYAIKLYPAGATTNSDAGVTDIRNTYATLETMAELGMPLLVHGEVTDRDVDVFDREKMFIERVLQPLNEKIPTLKIVFEHVTTRDAVEFVRQAPANVAATITPQHLLYNRNAMFNRGMRPHYYCLPVLKREQHRQALLEAAISGDPKFFLGTDSAPHPRNKKESDCGCAGIYNAPVAIEMYAQAFAQAGALSALEGFASFYGADFYGLPRNTDSITLQQSAWQVPNEIAMADTRIVPMCAGEQINWRLAD